MLPPFHEEPPELVTNTTANDPKLDDHRTADGSVTGAAACLRAPRS